MLDRATSRTSRESRRLDGVFRALAHPVRRAILSRMGSGEKTISELAEAPEPVVQGWRHFVGSLRSFVETGEGQPW